MIRIVILAVLAIVAYFGLTFLIEFRQPVVKELTSEMPDRAAEIATEQNKLPEIVLGHFKIDRTGSQQWVLDQTGLEIDTTEALSDRHAVQKELAFNGKDIWFSGLESVIPIKILEVTDNLVSFRVLDQKKPYTAFLQWDSQGAVWYSDYTLKLGGKQKLYRARYRKAK